MKPFDKRVNIITGHYGSGKTNLAVNMALDLAADGHKTCLVDLDIVNPYFRVSDHTGMLEAAGVRVIAPIHAGSNVETASLPGEVNAVFDDRSYTVVLDVGGDDVGAVALGRYSGYILKENNYEHFYVINARRALTQSPEEAVSILHEIEAASRVPVTALVNNTNLSVETDAQVIEASMDFAQSASEITGLPVAFMSVRKDIAGKLGHLKTDIYPVEVYVKLPW